MDECLITIYYNAAVAIQDAADALPSSLHIRGSAQNCTVVLVQIISPAQTAQVSANVVDGEWLAVFNANGDFNPADFPCGLAEIKVKAACKEDPACYVEGSIPALNCQLRGCPAQATLIVFHEGDSTDLVDPAECLPEGHYTVLVTDPLIETANYQWSLDGLTQSAASGLGQNAYDLYLPAGGAAQQLSVAILVDLNCFLSASVTLTPCDESTPPPEDCPAAVTLQLSAGGQPLPDGTDCLEPGGYTVSVTDPQGDDLSFSWSVDNVHLPGESGSSLAQTLAAGETRAVQVSVTRAGCPPVPGSLALAACAAPPEPPCPPDVILQVLDAQGQPVTADDCLPPGHYVVRVVQPEGFGVQYAWQVDGQPQPGQNSRDLPIGLPAGASRVVAAFVRTLLCPDASRQRVTLTGCDGSPRDCPDSVALEVVDGSGARVEDDLDCLPPGRYRVLVLEPDDPSVSFVWSVDGQVQAGQAGQSLNVELEEDETLSVSVSALQAGCDPVPAGVTLSTCDREQPDPPDPPPPPEPGCWCPILLYGGLILLIIGLVVLFGGACSVNVPAIVIGGVLAAAGFILLIAWAILCAPARGGCRLLATLIQLLSIASIALGVLAALFGVLFVICGLITSPTVVVAVICGLPEACGLGAAIDFGIVAVLAGILALIYFNTCVRRGLFGG